VLLVDSRAGSKDLIQPLVDLGLPVESTELGFGDIAFQGRGANATPVLIGIEFKKLDELVQALRTERLQGYQMIGMRATYTHSYLFIEGELLYDKKGRLLKRQKYTRDLTVMKGQMTVNELYKRVQVLHLCGGLNPWWTTKRADTLQAIAALYRTWTDVDVDQHKSHLAIYEAPPLLPISDFRRSIKTLRGIGMRASAAAERKFAGSLRAATAGTVSEWAAIEIIDDRGKLRRLGHTLAQRIVNQCEGVPR
jgi:ERCC4-type nuclease